MSSIDKLNTSTTLLNKTIDEWFDDLKHTYFKGQADEVRFADDAVFVFSNWQEADRFYKTLPKRLAKYGLEMSSEKSQILPGGRYAAARAHRQDKRLPTFKFLGFICYWGKAKNGFWRLKYSSRSDRFTAKLKGLRSFLRQNLNIQDEIALLKRTILAIRGWVNYHAISDNERRVSSFILRCKQILRAWLNRRGRRKPISWEKFTALLNLLGCVSKINVAI